MTLEVDQHLNLELISMKHLEELFTLVEKNRDYLKCWLPWLDMIKSRSDEKKYIHYYRNRFRNQGALTTTIMYRQQAVGVLSMNYIDWHRKTTALGYWLGSNFQNKGIMRHCVKRMLDHCFQDMDLQRVVIMCATGNHTSQKIPQKLGFTREGCLRKAEWLYDHYEDLYLYSMLKQEWAVSGHKTDAAS